MYTQLGRGFHTVALMTTKNLKYDLLITHVMSGDPIGADAMMNDVLWEAPNKAQQTMFIKLIGPNVNLGNIPPAEVVALEALRCGMRGDTFFDVLPGEFQSRKL